MDRLMDGLGKIQANRRFSTIRKCIPETRLQTGWIKYIRSVLGIKTKDLANRMQLSPQTVSETEKRELQGKVTLSKLNDYARAMDCELVYAIVPKKDVQTLIQEKALAKARALLELADTHMTLEGQKVKVDFDERVKLLADKLTKKGDVW